MSVSQSNFEITDERPASRGARSDRFDDASVPEFDRQPPQDLTAEQSVLGGMLLSKDAIADVV
ncbi:DnaB-like helicase N-terminal domain-containing protein, partial [Pseudonocardia spinosispora]|uniref:DnaB-like helicase N-terminal domain-containing protein n=1 Tax=Pseudonocardia spinosispora TaxID=103441 RepID=UPI00316AC096